MVLLDGILVFQDMCAPWIPAVDTTPPNTKVVLVEVVAVVVPVTMPPCSPNNLTIPGGKLEKHADEMLSGPLCLIHPGAIR